jgi:hypothetical protein
VLVIEDILGLFPDFTPKFAKRFTDVGLRLLLPQTTQKNCAPMNFKGRNIVLRCGSRAILDYADRHLTGTLEQRRLKTLTSARAPNFITASELHLRGTCCWMFHARLTADPSQKQLGMTMAGCMAMCRYFINHVFAASSIKI